MKGLLSTVPLRIVGNSASGPAGPEGDLAVTPELDGWRRGNSHEHFCREAFFVISGEAVVFAGERFFRCREGTLFLVDPRELHNSCYFPGAWGLHIWMKLQSDSLLCFFYQVVTEASKTVYSVQWSCGFEDQAVLKRINAAWDRIGQGAEDAEIELEALFRVVFCELYRRFDPVADNRNGMMLHIRKFVRDTCGRGVDINYLARLAGCSRQHFMRRFRDVNGCTVGEVVEDARRGLLETVPPGTPLKETAEKLGFDSASAFCHWRKKMIRKCGGGTGE